jgi:hypothetical protein
MSILIKGMEMPTSCLECDWCAHTIPADNYICYRLNRAVIGVAKEDVNETVNACCPIFPVPKHGRLIDANALARFLLNKYWDSSWISSSVLDRFVSEIANAPTIIPADPAEEGE